MVLRARYHNGRELIMGESIQSVLGVDGITLDPKPFPHLVTDVFSKPNSSIN
jgi:hypothetical protein